MTGLFGMLWAVTLLWLLTRWHVAFDLIESLSGEKFIHFAHQVLTCLSIN